MIGVCTETYDLRGSRIFKEADKNDMVNESGARRCSRTATLDGGCDIYDTGKFDSDRTIKIQENNVTLSTMEFVKYIIEYYGSIILATKDGVFRGVPSDYDVNQGQLNFNILVKEKLS